MMRKYLIGVAAVLFPAALLWPNGQGFARDWANHVWMVGYIGEYFRQHGSFPAVANTADVGGMTFPLFYGYLFYPLAGLLGTHLHPEIVVRLLAVLTLAAQYVSVRTTVRRLNGSDSLADAAACLTVWSVYALTNLYNRSALTEFYAVGALTCAVCAWFDLLRADTAARVWRRALRFGLGLTLAIGFHPITGVYALPLLGVLTCAAVRAVSLRRVVPACLAAAVASVVVLSPWVYAVRFFGKDLAINGAMGVTDYGEHLDRWQTRLNPLPADARCDDAAPKHVSTPYLDCQIGYPLALLAGGLAAAVVRREGGRGRWTALAFVAVPSVYALATVGLSLSYSTATRLPEMFQAVQFLYRLVSFANLGFLLVVLFALLWAVPRAGDGAPLAVSPVFLTFVVTYAGFCVLLKLQHAEVARTTPEGMYYHGMAAGREYRVHTGHRRWLKNESDRSEPTRLPTSSYGHNAYITWGHLQWMAEADYSRTDLVPLNVATRGGRFGDTDRLTVVRPHDGYVVVQVLVFPWNRFEVDGREIPPEELRSWSTYKVNPDKPAPPWTAVPVPAGTHTIRYRFEPNRTWKALRAASWVVLGGWVLALGVLSLTGPRRTAVTTAPPDIVPFSKAA